MLPRLYLPTRKPGIDARVRRPHPLTNGLIGAWLFNEGSGGTRNLAGASDNLALDGAATWTVTPEGQAGRNTGWNGFSNYAPSPAVRPAYLKTVLWQGVLLGSAGDLTDAPPLFAHYYDTAASAPYNCGSIHRYNDDSGLLFAWNNGTFGSFQVNGVMFAVNVPMQIALVLDGSLATGYLNAQSLANSTSNIPSAGSPILYGGSTFQTFGVHPSANVNTNAAASMILEWDRALSQSELLALRTNPYILFTAPSAMVVMIPPVGGTTFNITGTATQAQSVTLRRAVNLSRQLAQAQSLTLRQALLRTVSMTQAQALTVRQAVTLIRQLTQVSVATVALQRVLARTVSTTQAQAVTLQQAVTLSRQLVQAQSVARVQALSRSFALTQAQSLALVQGVARRVTATVAQAAARLVQVGLRRSVTQAETAAGTALQVRSVTLPLITQGQSVSLRRVVTLNRQLAQPQAVTERCTFTLARVLQQGQGLVVLKSTRRTVTAAQPQAVLLTTTATGELPIVSWPGSSFHLSGIPVLYWEDGRFVE